MGERGGGGGGNSRREDRQRDDRDEGRKRTHTPVTSTNTVRVHHTSDQRPTPPCQLHRARGVCSVQKWREAARGTPADRPTRQCHLLVSEVADDPG